MNALLVFVACLSLLWLPVLAQADALIIVDDRGGASALPYYEALNLQPRAEVSAPRLEMPRPPAGAVNEASMLPVRSLRLSPGVVARRVIEAPGLPPFFSSVTTNARAPGCSSGRRACVSLAPWA